MSLIPGAIIFVNDDLNDQVKEHLIKQLHINAVFDGYVFDQIIEADELYPQKIRQLQRRVMVIRSMQELENREIPDVVIFFKHGLASVLKNNFGPPGITVPALKIHWTQLCVFSHFNSSA